MNGKAKANHKLTTKKGIFSGCTGFTRNIEARATLLKCPGKLGEVATGFDALEVEKTC